MGFEVLIGGVGDAFSLNHHGTHFFVRKGDFLFAVDCPDSFRRSLGEHRFGEEEGPMEVGDLDGLFLTHLHGDHINGVEMTLAYRAMVIQGGALPVYGIGAVLDPLWEKRLQVSLGQFFDGERVQKLERERFYEPRQMALDASNRIGPFGVELRLTRHHIPTTAMRITDGEFTLAYSCDTAFDEELIQWLERDAEVILHECTFGSAHTQLEQLQGLEASIRERLVLVHYPDQMEGMDTGGLRLGKEGEVLRLG